MLTLFERSPWGDQRLFTEFQNLVLFKSYAILKFAIVVGFLIKNKENQHLVKFHTKHIIDFDITCLLDNNG